MKKLTIMMISLMVIFSSYLRAALTHKTRSVAAKMVRLPSFPPYSPIRLSSTQTSNPDKKHDAQDTLAAAYLSVVGAGFPGALYGHLATQISDIPASSGPLSGGLATYVSCRTLGMQANKAFLTATSFTGAAALLLYVG